MQGIKDLAASERGIFCIVILAAATYLAIVKVITGADWLTFAKWLAVTLVASKTLTGAAETFRPTPAPPPGPTS